MLGEASTSGLAKNSVWPGGLENISSAPADKLALEDSLARAGQSPLLDRIEKMTEHLQTPNGPIGSELMKEDPSYADIVVQFVEGLSSRLATMEEALSASDFSALRVAAHQLKGSGGGYGYPVLTERAAKLEQHAKASLVDQCGEELEELKQLCARVVVSAD